MRRIRYPSPFRCVAWGCLAVITWKDHDRAGGTCDDHHDARDHATPIVVGEPGTFDDYPPGFRLWAQLRHEGAIATAARDPSRPRRTAADPDASPR